LGVDIVPRFNRHMAGKAGRERRIVDGYAVFKLSEPPAGR
jgi:hypothetical protein